MTKYKVTYQENQKAIEEIVDAQTLSHLKLTKSILRIKVINARHFNLPRQHIKTSEFLNILNQMDMILKANLTLLETVQIVMRGCKNPLLIKLLLTMQKSLKSGKPLYTAFQGFEKYIDSLVIDFFKISHNKGNTPLIVSALCKVLNLKKSNKDMIFANLSYPFMILLAFVIALSIIFIFVIPQFEQIFIQYHLELPLYTTMLLSLKTFLVDNFLLFVSLFALLFGYVKIRLKSKKSSYQFDQFCALKIPIISELYLYYELYNFFICLNVLLKSNYEFNKALENSTLLLKNKYLLDRIQNINRDIQNGVSIYTAFDKAAIFDEIVLNLLNSGEKSSTMHEAIEKIEEYYKYNFTKNIKRFSSLIEPIFFSIMMLLILWVMLAIFTPIWNMSEMLNL